MPANEEHSTVSPVAKKDIMLKTVLKGKGKEEWELKPISSILMLKKTHYMKEAKPKGAEWP
jgi:hypothetical protein